MAVETLTASQEVVQGFWDSLMRPPNSPQRALVCPSDPGGKGRKKPSSLGRKCRTRESYSSSRPVGLSSGCTLVMWGL